MIQVHTELETIKKKKIDGAPIWKSNGHHKCSHKTNSMQEKMLVLYMSKDKPSHTKSLYKSMNMKGFASSY